ncbi:glycan-binding surface protein [Neolewinella agarilytica]|uniref:Complex I intermediate-associated protein 30 (CIA30) n=1 Tax=Neolewinella agarilytica TaxID=478744 RepID=A0A1H9HUX8_9BACT|nr:glycan-binding surface protein [Neolewinella agarilytica]SEQ66087.1 Complex I intermediate-associated protein 30 (CIA30) [Neolewinella agarilytica]
MFLLKSFPSWPLCFLLLIGILGLSSCDDKPDPPQFISIEPERGESKTLVVMKGENLANIKELLFNDELIPFNTAYNSDVALLFRVPTDISLGEKVVTVRTDGGSFTTNFLVTEKAPIVIRLSPRIANEGDLITLIGENFFAPLDVTFKTGEFVDGAFNDSISAEIVYESLDSLIVRVPEGAKTGFIRVDANGGSAQTNVTFQIFERKLISDFDGNGIVANDEFSFRGFTDQGNGAPYIRSSLPAPLEGNFLQLSGTDALGTVWLGGAESPGGDMVDSFGITTDVSSTFLEMDVNSNGRTNTWLLLVLREQNGSTSDFTARIQLNDEGWTHVSIPLVRFKDAAGFVVDPQKVNQIKFHLEDRDDTDQRIEANIDNVEFAERI